MKRKGLMKLLAAAAILAGCSAAGSAAETTAAAEATVAINTNEETMVAEIIQNTVGAVQEAASSKAAEETTVDSYADLTLNKYGGLEMTATILPRNAILPGMTVPITIVVTNNGDQSVAYVHGSGSFTTPQAIHLDVKGLQPILAEDNLGIATMDYVVKELKSGESLQFTMNVKTIEPNENFIKYTYDLFFSKQIYIGDMNMEELFKTYDDLTPAATGAYEGVATFVYYLTDDAQNANVFGEANGYIQAPITISVN